MSQHTHSYVFYKKTDNKIWYKCNDPLCYHSIDREMAEGKASLCPDCQETIFVLTKDSLKRKRPLCLDCADTAEAKKHRAAKALVSDLFKDIREEEESA